MIIRKVDAENDWTFGKGKSDYAIQEAAIEQNVQGRILSWVGDCFFALPEGVDWKNRLDVGEQDNLLDEMKSVILQSEGVTGVNSLTGTFDGTTRTFLIEYDIQTIYSSSFQSEVTQTIGGIASV